MSFTVYIVLNEGQLELEERIIKMALRYRTLLRLALRGFWATITVSLTDHKSAQRGRLGAETSV